MTQKQKETIEQQKQIIKEYKESIKKQDKKPTIDEQGHKILYKKQWDKKLLELFRGSKRFQNYFVRLNDLRTGHELSMHLEDWEAENLMLALRKEFSIVPRDGEPKPYFHSSGKNLKKSEYAE